MKASPKPGKDATQQGSMDVGWTTPAYQTGSDGLAEGSRPQYAHASPLHYTPFDL